MPDGGAHRIKRLRQAAHLVFGADPYFNRVILPRHLGRGAVQLFHRFHDTAG
jgi:hypothetical protein